ncbi:MAG TPA: hypothetical protein VFJ18_10805, partial [Pararhizobium sp.]|nr:hypothetical protein [Pararhizobium sp.]
SGNNAGTAKGVAILPTGSRTRLERSVDDRNRWRFPNLGESDSPFLLEEEAGMDGKGLFSGFARPGD